MQEQEDIITVEDIKELFVTNNIDVEIFGELLIRIIDNIPPNSTK